MIGKLSSYITDVLVEGKIIEEKERRLYRYCVEGLVEMVGNLLITLLIGFLFGKMAETLIFLIVFIPLRSIAGGCHVQNGTHCFLISLILFFVVIMSAGYFWHNLAMVCSIRYYLAAITYICLFGPVDCKNKRLDQEQKKNLKKRIFICAAMISLMYMLLLVIGGGRFCFVISNSVFLIALLMIVGELENMGQTYHSGS